MTFGSHPTLIKLWSFCHQLYVTFIMNYLKATQRPFPIAIYIFSGNNKYRHRWFNMYDGVQRDECCWAHGVLYIILNHWTLHCLSCLCWVQCPKMVGWLTDEFSHTTDGWEWQSWPIAWPIPESRMETSWGMRLQLHEGLNTVYH